MPTANIYCFILWKSPRKTNEIQQGTYIYSKIDLLLEFRPQSRTVHINAITMSINILVEWNSCLCHIRRLVSPLQFRFGLPAKWNTIGRAAVDLSSFFPKSANEGAIQSIGSSIFILVSSFLLNFSVKGFFIRILYPFTVKRMRISSSLCFILHLLVGFFVTLQSTSNNDPYFLVTGERLVGLYNFDRNSDNVVLLDSKQQWYSSPCRLIWPSTKRIFDLI